MCANPNVILDYHWQLLVALFTNWHCGIFIMVHSAVDDHVRTDKHVVADLDTHWRHNIDTAIDKDIASYLDIFREAKRSMRENA